MIAPQPMHLALRDGGEILITDPDGIGMPTHWEHDGACS
jgi:hypothetical protein